MNKDTNKLITDRGADLTSRDKCIINHSFLDQNILSDWNKTTSTRDTLQSSDVWESTYKKVHLTLGPTLDELSTLSHLIIRR